jgi:NodT family efflux transporter outer membrane factor (OMF) lipoprotein
MNAKCKFSARTHIDNRSPDSASVSNTLNKWPEISVRKRLVVSALSFCITGCSLLEGPAFHRPNTPTKTEWVCDHAQAREAIDREWWKNFQDPYLDDLVEKAIAGNFALRVAAARIEEAEALLGGARAGWWPTLSAGISAPYTYTRQELPKGASLGGKNYTSQSALADKYSIDLNWEIDFWGKIRKGVQAQQASHHATEADWRAAWLKTVADVAELYFSIRQLDEQIDQQKQAIGRNEVILNIFRNQAAEGIIPVTTVLSQEAENKVLQQGLQEFERRRLVADNGLATLLGLPAGSLRVPVDKPRDHTKLPQVPAALPSDLLSRRPDVIAAEYRVLEAHELVGQARLARLPTISATANGGMSHLLSTAIKVWTYGMGPAINIPIFDQKLIAQVEINKARTHVAEEEYRQSVIRAFEEVENAMASLSSRKTQQETLRARRENLMVVAQKQQEQLREGLITQLEVFESQRRLLEVEQSLSVLNQQLLVDTLTLYKALGGGWPAIAVAGN